MSVEVVKVSAPGKVILHGEHSVVYGKTAIAASLGMRTTVKIEEKKSLSEHSLTISLLNLRFGISFSIPSLKNSLFNIPSTGELNWQNPQNIDYDAYSKNIREFLDEHTLKFDIKLVDTEFQAILIVLYMFCAILNKATFKASLVLSVQSDLTIGAGTGSSASFAVSLAAAMYQYLRLSRTTPDVSARTETKLKVFSEEEKHIISNWAFSCEKIAHGSPSGVDNATCTFGAMVEFRKGSPPIPHSLSLKLKILLVDTRVSRQTRDLVQKVILLRKRFPEVVDSIMDSLDQVALTALKQMKKMDASKLPLNDERSKALVEDYAKLSELYEINHKLLTVLDVSHESLERVRAISAKFGFSCKLTGAGGGGFAIVLIPFDADDETVQKLKQNINGSGFLAKLTEIGGEGVLIS